MISRINEYEIIDRKKPKMFLKEKDSFLIWKIRRKIEVKKPLVNERTSYDCAHKQA
jgi:hypothetical protein